MSKMHHLFGEWREDELGRQLLLLNAGSARECQYRWDRWASSFGICLRTTRIRWLIKRRSQPRSDTSGNSRTLDSAALATVMELKKKTWLCKYIHTFTLRLSNTIKISLKLFTEKTTKSYRWGCFFVAGSIRNNTVWWPFYESTLNYFGAACCDHLQFPIIDWSDTWNIHFHSKCQANGP